MKKTLFVLSVLSSLVIAADVAHADPAPTAELKVVGELSVPTCTVDSADGGVYDIGKQSSNLIKPSAETGLNPMTKTWTVTCDAATYMNFTPTDNRAGSKSNAAATSFGLGSVNGTGKIGYFVAKATKGMVDGVSTGLFTSSAATFTSKSEAMLTSNQKTGWSTANNTQANGKVFVTDIEVTPVLASTTTMNGAITDATDIDGSVTLTFAYGI